MSANQIMEAIEKYPVWTVHGVNWQADVRLDGVNATLEPDMQAQEAATQAIAAYKGKANGIVIKLDEGETMAELGTTMIAHLVGEKPQDGFIPFTHVMLANEGLYKESHEMGIKFAAQMAALQQEHENNEQVRKQLENEALTLPIEPKKARKGKGKKISPKKPNEGLDKPPTP